jgi:hypothetical protein
VHAPDGIRPASLAGPGKRIYLAQRQSHLNAVQAEDGTSIEPSTIYVIPRTARFRSRRESCSSNRAPPTGRVSIPSMCSSGRWRVMPASARSERSSLRLGRVRGTPEIKYMGEITIARNPRQRSRTACSLRHRHRGGGHSAVSRGDRG